MQIEKNLLLTTMRKCLPGVDRGNSLIEGTDTFVFTGDALHSFNDNISVSTSLNLPGLVGSVKSVDFFKLVSKFKAEFLEITPMDGAWEIKAGPTKATITLITSTITKHLENLKIAELTFAPLPEDFASAVKLCLMSGNSHPSRGIFVAEDQMVSTDAVRLNRYVFEQSLGTSFYLDDPAAAELLKVGELQEFAVTDGWVSFKTKDGSVFSCKRKDAGQYPFDRLIAMMDAFADTTGEIANVLPASLSEAVDRISVLATDISGAQAIRMTIRRNDVVIYAERAAGKAEEAVNWETPFAKDPGVEVWVDSTFLREACTKVRDFAIRSNENVTVMVFHSPRFTQVAATMVTKA